MRRPGRGREVFVVFEGLEMRVHHWLIEDYRVGVCIRKELVAHK